MGTGLGVRDLMTKRYSYEKWQTSRVWPGGGWGEALAQVRKDQQLTQSELAEYVGVALATVRNWEQGSALPDRALWSRLEEAIGIPIPDPRVPEHAPAERELIDTLLLMIDELRMLRADIGRVRSAEPPPNQPVDPKILLDIEGAAERLGITARGVRNLVAERRLVHYKIGRRVMFRPADLEAFVDEGKRDTRSHIAWQLRGREGESPRKSRSL